MLASGPALLLALLLLQGGTEFQAGANVETRIGEVPGPASGSTQFQVVLAATPTLGLRWSGEASEASARSDTRILWRPVPLLTNRPLFLESVAANLLTRPSRRSRLQLDLRGSYGEEDYTYLSQQLGNQATLPLARTMLTVLATGEGYWRQSRRSMLTLSLAGTHRRTPDTQSASVQSSAGIVLPTQTQVTATPGVRYALDRRSSLEALLALGETDTSNFQLGTIPNAHMNILTFQPQLGIVRDLSRSQRVRAVAGMTYAAVLVNPDRSRNWLPLTPLLGAELGSLLWRTRASTVRSNLAAATAWYADPVLGGASWRGSCEARLEAQLGLRWNVGARAAFITDLSKPLPPVGTDQFVPDETVAVVELPFHYRWTTQVDVQFGARYAERAPNLRATDFAWHNRELWAFLSLAATNQRLLRPRS